MSEKIEKLREIDTPFILNLMADKCNSGSQEVMRNVFKVGDKYDFEYSERKHRLLTGSALKLAKKVIANGGTEDEVKRSLEYLWACINMKTYMLNYRKAYVGLRIEDISTKYDFYEDSIKSE